MGDFIDFLHVVICILLNIHWSYQNLLFWAGIVRHRLSANQIVRCFKLRKLKNYMRYQVDFLLPLKLQKISYYFGLCWKLLLANQFAGFFTFDLFDLIILILEFHCYIVLVAYFYHNIGFMNFWLKCLPEKFPGFSASLEYFLECEVFVCINFEL